MMQAARREAAAGYALAAPAFLLLLAFVLGPTLVVIALSFSDYRLAAPAMRFAGLDNYAEMLADPLVWNALRNTAAYVAIVVPGSVGLGLVIALLVQPRRWLGGFYRAAYFLPVASTMVAMATVWEYLLHPSFGPVNQMLALFGVHPVNFLGDTDTALPSLAAVGIWEMTGLNMVLFLAGLAAIPRDLYAAAAIDGVDSGWERFCTVTWPMLGPTTLFVVLVTAIRAFRVFDIVALLTQGGPGKATEVLLYRIYVTAFQYLRIGYASALTVAFLGFVLMLALLQGWLIGRRVHYT